jgi:hypothetical protein
MNLYILLTALMALPLVATTEQSKADYEWEAYAYARYDVQRVRKLHLIIDTLGVFISMNAGILAAAIGQLTECTAGWSSLAWGSAAAGTVWAFSPRASHEARKQDYLRAILIGCQMRGNCDHLRAFLSKNENRSADATSQQIYDAYPHMQRDTADGRVA